MLIRSVTAAVALFGSLSLFSGAPLAQAAPNYLAATLRDGTQAVKSDDAIEAWLRRISVQRATLIALPISQQVIRECAARLAGSEKRKLHELPALCKSELYYSVQAATEYNLGLNLPARHCVNLAAFKTEIRWRMSTYQQNEVEATHGAMFHCAGADESVRRGLHFAGRN